MNWEDGLWGDYIMFVYVEPIASESNNLQDAPILRFGLLWEDLRGLIEQRPFYHCVCMIDITKWEVHGEDPGGE